MGKGRPERLAIPIRVHRYLCGHERGFRAVYRPKLVKVPEFCGVCARRLERAERRIEGLVLDYWTLIAVVRNSQREALAARGRGE